MLRLAIEGLSLAERALDEVLDEIVDRVRAFIEPLALNLAAIGRGIAAGLRAGLRRIGRDDLVRLGAVLHDLHAYVLELIEGVLIGVSDSLVELVQLAQFVADLLVSSAARRRFVQLIEQAVDLLLGSREDAFRLGSALGTSLLSDLVEALNGDRPEIARGLGRLVGRTLIDVVLALIGAVGLRIAAKVTRRGFTVLNTIRRSRRRPPPRVDHGRDLRRGDPDSSGTALDRNSTSGRAPPLPSTVERQLLSIELIDVRDVVTKYLRRHPCLSHDADTVHQLADIFRKTMGRVRNSRTGLMDETPDMLRRAAAGELKVIERAVRRVPAGSQVRLLRPPNRPGDRTPDLQIEVPDGALQVEIRTVTDTPRYEKGSVEDPTLARRVPRSRRDTRGNDSPRRHYDRTSVYGAFVAKLDRDQLKSDGVICVVAVRPPGPGELPLTAQQIRNLEGLMDSYPNVKELVLMFSDRTGQRAITIGSRTSGLNLADGQITAGDAARIAQARRKVSNALSRSTD